MAKGIWVVAEQRDGKLKKVTLEMISKAKALGDEVTVLLLGSQVEGLAAGLGAYGAARVLVFDADVLKSYTTDAYTKVIADAVREGEPSILLGGATATGKDLLPRVAARLGTGLASDCIDLRLDNGKLVATRPIYAGKCVVDTVIPDSFPQMASVRPNVLAVGAQDASKKAEVVKKEVKVSSADLKAIVKEIVKGASERVDLTEATIIVSGGRAMKASENFKILWDLADAFGPGSTVGASRAAVDSGFAVHSMQVGQTGKVVNPNLYVACGISGAIQHLAGMRTSKVIVAINKDPEAPIFQKADYGIVGDLFKIVPLLTEEVKKLKAQD
ncbi:MAG: electron transfer flavoprotein subunit alpha/FixB family protein [bacterium]